MREILKESQILLEYDRKDLKAFAGTDLANRYLSLRPKLQAPENDLGYWIKKGNLKEFEKFITDWETGKIKSKTQDKKEKRLEGAELVFNDKGWKTYFITTYQAAKQLGSGTTWCITGRYRGAESKGKYYFDSYIRSYNLNGGYYFIFDTLNKDPKTGDYLKYCAGVTQDGKLRFLFNGMQDREISRTGIPNIPEDRQVQPVPGVVIKFERLFETSGDTLVSFNESAIPKVADQLIINIPDGIKKLNNFSLKSFGLKHEIENLVFPSSIKTIGKGALSESNIGMVAIPDSIEEIKDGAFFSSGINSILINSPAPLRRIEKYTFAYCEDLKELRLPENIDYIDDLAFYGTDLNNITIFDANDYTKQRIEELKNRQES